MYYEHIWAATSQALGAFGRTLQDLGAFGRTLQDLGAFGRTLQDFGPLGKSLQGLDHWSLALPSPALANTMSKCALGQPNAARTEEKADSEQRAILGLGWGEVVGWGARFARTDK